MSTKKQRAEVQRIRESIDRLARVRLDIAELQAQESQLRDSLLPLVTDFAEGYEFIVNRGSQRSTRWKAIAQRFDPSRQLVRAHTTKYSVLRTAPRDLRGVTR